MSKYPRNWNKVRKIILERDGHKCYFCGISDNLDVHHIRPLSKDGNNETYNLITLCESCHVADHAHIRENGLCTIPGPEWEPHRGYLTNYTDVEVYCEKVEADGINMDYARFLNRTQ